MNKRIEKIIHKKLEEKRIHKKLERKKKEQIYVY